MATLFKGLSKKNNTFPICYNLYQKLLSGNYLQKMKGVIEDEGFLNTTYPILDLGCGTGIFSRFFRDDCYIGMDINQKSMNYAHKIMGGRYIVGDVKILPFKSNLFRKVLAIGLFHHLSDAEAMMVLNECHNVIQQEGKFLIIDAVFSKNRYKFLGNLLRKFDAGSYIREFIEYHSLFSKTFLIKKQLILECSIADYCVFVLKK